MSENESVQQLEAKLVRYDEQRQALKKKIRQTKQAKRAQLIKALGTTVLKQTKAENLADFQTKFAVVPRSVLKQADESITLAQVRALADSLHQRNGGWWSDDLHGLLDQLASYRTDNPPTNPVELAPFATTDNGGSNQA